MPPEVVITTPYNGQKVKRVFTLEAEASDYDGEIVSVEFYAGDKLLGKTEQFPYLLQGVTLPAGNYQIKVKAIDNQGGESITDRVNIVVTK